ncbi:hypothetical protein DPM19_10420 [Actinomadura craniellae]|uniref:DNA-binding protein n=1 Tax=Actinomadura craniellae TaxID=2231787 RepID=A0A365HA32_9ACTN|nr:hypothetical protein [Actinomadura craniellae]RAY15133.1 hypothetical protein DPM19_10420 [Actinomadura craniellae]
MPGYDFELILSRPFYEAELDPLFQRTHGAVTVGFVREGQQAGRPGQAGADWQAPSLAVAMMDVIAHIEASAPGLRVLRVEADPLLSMHEIAERVGRSVESVRLCIKGARGPGHFPAAETSTPRHRLWRWSHVADWYGIQDPQILEAGPTSQAVNGWLALREVVPDVAPAPHELTEALSAVFPHVA